MTIQGTDLSPEDQRYVLAAYVHRFTGDNKPAWANELRPSGKPYPLQFTNDQEWLYNTWFAVTKAGRIDRRYSGCTSEPTWPNGKD